MIKIKSKRRAINSGALVIGLLLAAMPASAQAKTGYVFCTFNFVSQGKLVEYYSDVFNSSISDLNVKLKYEKDFRQALVRKIGKQPSMTDKNGNERRASCLHHQSRPTREEAGAYKEFVINTLLRNGRVIYQTGWTPNLGLKDISLVEAPSK